MYRLALITVLGLLGCVNSSQSPHYQVLAVIPHGRSPPLVDITEQHNAQQDDMSVAQSQYYPAFEDYDDFRSKRELDESHPDAYLKPPAEDASTPLWQDGNNWDLGYDPSEILTPPMPLSLGIPYDTIKLSSDDARAATTSFATDVTEAQGSSPQRQEARPTKPRQYKPRPYKKRPPQNFAPQRERYNDYEDSRDVRDFRDSRPFSSDSRPFSSDSRPFSSDSRPFSSESRPFQSDSRPFSGDNRPFSPKRPNRFADYEDAPIRPNKRQTYKGGYHQDRDSFSDYDDLPRPQASFSFSQTDQNGHYKWGVRHHQ